MVSLHSNISENFKTENFLGARRLLLKISGQFLQGTQTHGICWNVLDQLCADIACFPQYQWILMVGGGNFLRGQEAYAYCKEGIADTMGMLSTVLNALALNAGFAQRGMTPCLLSARLYEGIGQPFNTSIALDALNKGHIIICAGGLGHGAMTTDTAAVVRACELECDLILKGTRVQGVYSADPLIHKDAVFYPHLTYTQALSEKIGVMDLTALTLAEKTKKNMVVFSLEHSGLHALFSRGAPYSLLTEKELIKEEQ